jgi:hypothetical protein
MLYFLICWHIASKSKNRNLSQCCANYVWRLLLGHSMKQKLFTRRGRSKNSLLHTHSYKIKLIQCSPKEIDFKIYFAKYATDDVMSKRLGIFIRNFFVVKLKQPKKSCQIWHIWVIKLFLPFLFLLHKGK